MYNNYKQVKLIDCAIPAKGAINFAPDQLPVYIIITLSFLEDGSGQGYALTDKPGWTVSATMCSWNETIVMLL